MLKIDRKQTDTMRDIATETDSMAEIPTETETMAETETGSIRVGTRKRGGPASQSGMYSVPSHRLTKISRGRHQKQSIGFYAFRKSSIIRWSTLKQNVNNPMHPGACPLSFLSKNASK